MPPTASSPPPEPPALPVGGAVFTVHFVRDRTEAIHVMHTGPQPCRATCALFRALCEFVLLFCFESVLLSCSNSPSWPSRSRCLVSVVTHVAMTILPVCYNKDAVSHRPGQLSEFESIPPVCYNRDKASRPAWPARGVHDPACVVCYVM